jgi:hypothetical protein
MDQYLEEKSSLQHLLATGTQSAMNEEERLTTEQIEEILRHLCGCEKPCRCEVEEKDELMEELQEMAASEENIEK